MWLPEHGLRCLLKTERLYCSLFSLVLDWSFSILGLLPFVGDILIVDFTFFLEVSWFVLLLFGEGVLVIGDVSILTKWSLLLSFALRLDGSLLCRRNCDPLESRKRSSAGSDTYSWAAFVNYGFVSRSCSSSWRSMRLFSWLCLDLLLLPEDRSWTSKLCEFRYLVLSAFLLMNCL